MSCKLPVIRSVAAAVGTHVHRCVHVYCNRLVVCNSRHNEAPLSQLAVNIGTDMCCTGKAMGAAAHSLETLPVVTVAGGRESLVPVICSQPGPVLCCTWPASFIYLTLIVPICVHTSQTNHRCVYVFCVCVCMWQLPACAHVYMFIVAGYSPPTPTQ